jgi:signal transduction histidine kinase/ligand-binding sensor domain-containing protein
MHLWIRPSFVALIAVATMLLATEVRGQLPSPQEDYIIDVWESDDGLPQNSVIALAQTTDGFIWLSTFAGLARFDGKRFDIFDDDVAPELSGGVFVGLCASKNGSLWLRERHNLLFLRENGIFRPIGEKEGMTNRAAVLESAPDGTVWAGDSRGALWKWDGKRFNLVTDTPPAPSWGPYYALAFDSAGNPWMCGNGTNGGYLARLENGQWVAMAQHEEGTEFGLVRRLRDGSMAVVTGGHGGRLSRYTEKGLISSEATPDEPRGYLTAEDDNGDLWITSMRGILRREPNGRYTEMTRASGLAADPVRSELFDREGNRWFGTSGGGVMRLKRRGVEAFGLAAGMSQKVALSVAVDSPQTAWVAVLVGGLNYFATNQFSLAATSGGLESNAAVWCVTKTSDNLVWCGTYGGGLYQLNPETQKLRRFDAKSDPEMLRDPIKALFQSRSGDLWFGGDGGVARYSAGKFQSFRSTNGLSDNTVTSIAQTQDGAIWVGARLGLNRIVGTNIQVFTTADGLAGNAVYSLFCDRGGGLWIGGHSLTRYKHGRFFAIGDEEGLPVHNVRGIMEDDLGYLWLGTTHGVLRAHRRQLDTVCSTNNAMAQFLTFGRSDGLPSDECSGSQPSIAKGPDGRLWFATVNGLGIIDPKKLEEKKPLPPVVIESIVADDRPLSMNAGGANPVVRVPPGTQRLEFRFAALNFTSAEKNRFRYRLDNYESGWSRPDLNEVATYTRLPPGSYRFNVCLCNSFGAWDQSDASLAIVLAPFFWETSWFRFLIVAMIVGVISWMLRARLAVLERRRLAQEAFSRQLIQTQEKERQRIAHELHDGVGQSLILAKNHIVSVIARAGASAPFAGLLSQISTEVSEALEEIRATSRALRPVELDRLGLAKSLEAMLGRAGHGTTIKIMSDLEDLEDLAGREVGIQLYRIAQEAINNVLKHSHAQRVIVELKREQDSVRLTIQDNGDGFDPAASTQQNGFGLAGMAERARIIGGSFSVNAQPGSGCRLTVIVPLPPKSS